MSCLRRMDGSLSLVYDEIHAYTSLLVDHRSRRGQLHDRANHQHQRRGRPRCADSGDRDVQRAYPHPQRPNRLVATAPERRSSAPPRRVPDAAEDARRSAAACEERGKPAAWIERPFWTVRMKARRHWLASTKENATSRCSARPWRGTVAYVTYPQHAGSGAPGSSEPVNQPAVPPSGPFSQRAQRGQAPQSRLPAGARPPRPQNSPDRSDSRRRESDSAPARARAPSRFRLQSQRARA